MKIGRSRLHHRVLFALVFVVLIVAAVSNGYGQAEGKLPKRIYVQATVMGTSTQMGQVYQINIIIEELSTPADKAALVEAFKAKGNEGLVNALSKMPSKGRMSIVGTLGYDVAYMRTFPQPDGSILFRLVTDRPITFGEAWADTRSRDYNLSALELTVAKDKKGKYKGQGKGTLLPACQFKLDNDGHLDIELRQNAWNVVNVSVRQ